MRGGIRLARRDVWHIIAALVHIVRTLGALVISEGAMEIMWSGERLRVKLYMYVRMHRQRRILVWLMGIQNIKLPCRSGLLTDQNIFGKMGFSSVNDAEVQL